MANPGQLLASAASCPIRLANRVLGGNQVAEMLNS
jgi:hypothetical protein